MFTPHVTELVRHGSTAPVRVGRGTLATAAPATRPGSPAPRRDTRVRIAERFWPRAGSPRPPGGRRPPPAPPAARLGLAAGGSAWRSAAGDPAACAQLVEDVV